ncbi:hypothetical protein DTO169E5_2263 [Paecilomyces variotii]|nr:hypothetical protein DTO169E5_2263 [Paecilomyces variotii]
MYIQQRTIRDDERKSASLVPVTRQLVDHPSAREKPTSKRVDRQLHPCRTIADSARASRLCVCQRMLWRRFPSSNVLNFQGLELEAAPRAHFPFKS